MKTWKTITLTAFTASSLCLGGLATYQYLQPQSYQGEVFYNEKTKQTSDNSFSSEQQQSKQSSTSTTSSESFQSQVDTTVVPEYYKSIPLEEFVKSYNPQGGGTNIPTVTTMPTTKGYAIVNNINPTDVIIVETTDNYTIAHQRMQEAKDFANWINSIAQGKPLQHSLYDNLQYYFNNVN